MKLWLIPLSTITVYQDTGLALLSVSPESTMRYIKRTKDDTALRNRIRGVSSFKGTVWKDRIHGSEKEGWMVNHKKYSVSTGRRL